MILRKAFVRLAKKSLLLIGVALLVLLRVQSPGINAGSLLKIYGEDRAQNTPASAGNIPQSKNPYVAALEKKIAGQENEPAEKIFKNLEIFKGLPAGRILRVMEVAFNNSLGVDCTHCHIAEQWEKDDKEAKQTARKMWHFTNKLNQDLKQAIGKGTVNCTTCHRGQIKPALSLPSPK
ncbi:MAG TPA: photosynthetic reaction center cytochrome c subunit family protein [Blastocatellia bacterium]|nr:photosynthetic reaction center cytochrome c subunit family protein [Blastocatellia bacterium]HMX27191.1 photosynthetic reaction center cytochrome c subunit family protein [Blastocatellia bacterium]HMY71400.1 photosynthetic reaction center cytochrome c subunit family protein [Blastocatellia bacterium]HNG33895.1 photosynthetic reaction center cytochrome c subunit family protein [Blastocatellia bacterium]